MRGIKMSASDFKTLQKKRLKYKDTSNSPASLDRRLTRLEKEVEQWKKTYVSVIGKLKLKGKVRI